MVLTSICPNFREDSGGLTFRGPSFGFDNRPHLPFNVVQRLNGLKKANFFTMKRFLFSLLAVLMVVCASVFPSQTAVAASGPNPATCSFTMVMQLCHPGEPGDIRQICLAKNGKGGTPTCNSGGCGDGIVIVHCNDKL